MPSRIKRAFAGLELEERILNGASLLAIVSVFLPWISGQWLGDEDLTYSGFQFFTSIIGIIIFLCHVSLLALTVIPMFGGKMMLRKKQKEIIRLCLAGQATILSLAALSVLTKVTYDYTRMEIRFGIYCTFIGSLVAAFYAFWRLQEFRKSESQDLFHHPDDRTVATDRIETVMQTPPPPPPPPPLQPEEHHLRP